MKQIFLDGEPTSFFITQNGFLYRKDTQNWYTPYENGGYLSYMLKWNNKSYHRRIHRLLAEAYLDNPNNLPFVHHEDGDPFNNILDNLKWVSIEENNQSTNKTLSIAQEGISPIDLNEEIEQWKQYENTTFYVSDFGRVKNIKTKNILKGTVLKTGYQRIIMKINGIAIGKLTHRLVWEVWYGKPIESIINHKNGNKLDNRLINLENISQSENIIKSCYEMGTNNNCKIVGYSKILNGELEGYYPSLKKAARANNVHETSILQAIRLQNRSCGFYWRYIDD